MTGKSVRTRGGDRRGLPAIATAVAFAAAILLIAQVILLENLPSVDVGVRSVRGIMEAVPFGKLRAGGFHVRRESGSASSEEMPPPEAAKKDVVVPPTPPPEATKKDVGEEVVPPTPPPPPAVGAVGDGIEYPAFGKFDLLDYPLYPSVVKGDDSVRLSREVLEMCTRTLWHTIETTTIVLPDDETFVHTGDLDDLWLRDSAAQVHTLLVPFGGSGGTLIAGDARLDRIVSGLIKRTAMYIRHDPYANAFRIDDSYVFSAAQKKLGRHDLISTWNYELDSGCYYLRMLWYYWRATDRGTRGGARVLRLPSVTEAVEILIELWETERRHEDDAYPSGPLFDCQNCGVPHRYPSLDRKGKGAPTNATSGLTWTAFRPSDDACQYHFLVPANMFAVAALEYAMELAQEAWDRPDLYRRAGELAAGIRRGIRDHAVVEHPKHGKIYAYEVDGLGNANLMDDANVPSLVSVPYLGYRHHDPEVYANTRQFVFSKDNPTYKKGNNRLTGMVEGYGSPHMQERIKKNIWPMSIAMRGLTIEDPHERAGMAELLVKASAGTHWMHESFDVNNPKKFTRSWFCWADSLFAELVMTLTDACPDASYKYKVLEWRDTKTVQGGPFASS
mmetsp:Transcript_32106/g.73869  ORF Transcript_32106/g.73869 Transcript_32106/m.73869 type:complete len:617 (-) Transcript_32106:428-2278(-)